MKKIFSLVYLLVFSFSSFSQSKSQKGNFMAGGTLVNLYAMGESISKTYRADTLYSVQKINGNYAASIQLAFALDVGYFVKENLSLGLRLGINGTAVSTSFRPFCRYYLKHKETCFSFARGQERTRRSSFFLELTPYGNYSFNHAGNNNSNFNIGASGGIGFAYLISNYFAVESELLVNGSISGSNTEAQTIAPYISSSRSSDYGFNLLFGFQTYFGK